MLEDRYYMRQEGGRPGMSMTILLIIVNTGVYFLQQILEHTQGGAYFIHHYLALSPAGMKSLFIWQLLTFQFLHGGLFHLVINCLMLYMFGRPMEIALGPASFLRLYFLSGAFGGIFQSVGGLLMPSLLGGVTVGASAGVFGLIAGFAAMNPEQPLTALIAFILPVTIKAKYLVLAELIISFLGIIGSGRDGIAHGAHLGGILAGIAYVRYIVTGRIQIVWPQLPAWLRPASTKRRIIDVKPTREVFWRKPKPPPSRPEEVPPSEFISKEVDPILDKIAAHGIHSLTPRERKILETARSKMSRR